jgi:predicted ABC-class ATPase
MTTIQNLGVQEASIELQRLQFEEQKAQRVVQEAFQEKQLLEQKAQREVQEASIELQRLQFEEQKAQREVQEKQFVENQRNLDERVKDRKQSTYISAQQQLSNKFSAELQTFIANSRLENADPNIKAPTPATHEDIIELSNEIQNYIDS